MDSLYLDLVIWFWYMADVILNLIIDTRKGEIITDFHTPVIKFSISNLFLYIIIVIFFPYSVASTVRLHTVHLIVSSYSSRRRPTILSRKNHTCVADLPQELYLAYSSKGHNTIWELHNFAVILKNWITFSVGLLQIQTEYFLL